MALTSSKQEDWGGGIFRQRKAPPDGCYDAVNALLGDDGLLFKRGGSAYKSAVASGALDMLLDVFVAAGARTLQGSSAATTMWALDVDDTSLVSIGTSAVPFTRAAVAGGIAFMRGPSPNTVLMYAGSRIGAQHQGAGTATVTAGSTAVVGVGTSWVSQLVQAGDFLEVISGSAYVGVVKSVQTNTTLTLVSPWNGPTVAGASPVIVGQVGLAPTTVTSYGGTDGSIYFLAGIGSSARLVLAVNQRVYLSARGDPLTFDAASYLELPSDTVITGADATEDSAIIFTTRGVWLLSNLELDAEDDFGNIQWSQRQVSKDLILWGDPGIAAWEGRLIVPAIDDVYLFSPGSAPDSITTWTIRSLYQSYVKAGYSPGTAVVHRGHYLLPIMNGGTLVDVLVARLNRPHLLSARPRIWIYPWTRLSGHAAGGAYAQRVGGTVRSPKLFGINSTRTLDLTSIFDPTSANAVEADATTHTCTIESNDLPTGSSQPGTVVRARATYVLTDDGSGATAAPTVALAVSSDEDAGSYSTLTVSGLQQGGTGGAVSDGTKYSFWNFAKRRQRVRYRLTQTGACASFVLRSFETFTRGSGKQ